MVRARELVHRLGGADRTRFFTKLWLAVLGHYPWEHLPVLPPEMILLPDRAPLSPYRFACWARGTFVALMIVLSRQPTYRQAVGPEELFTDPAGHAPRRRSQDPRPLDTAPDPGDGRWRAATTAGRSAPLRRLAEARVARWICDRQEADGSWGGIQPPWVYSIFALHALGWPLDHPVIARALAGFDDTFTVRRRRPPAHPGVPVAGVGHLPGRGGAGRRRRRRPAIRPSRAACDWMLSKEVTRYGDWHHIPRRGRPGGWSFEFANEWYPDTDDTAEVLIALRKAGHPAAHPAVRRGVDWLLAMQSANGGWGAFDVDNDRRVMTQLPLCDFGEVLDPPTEDVTAHVVEALVQCGVPRDHPAVRRAVAYLWDTQRDDGSWWGRWGVNHIYGTGAVLPALAAAGEDMERAARPPRRRLAGRAPEPGRRLGRATSESYRRPEWIGRGASTASQTAWALLALLAAATRPPGGGRGPRLPGAHPAAGRIMGRALVHRHRVPGGLHDQLPPLPPGVPRDRPGPAHSDERGPRAARGPRRRARGRPGRHDENFPVAFRSWPRATCAPT